LVMRGCFVGKSCVCFKSSERIWGAKASRSMALPR
jgi:hypothetical protein